MFTYPNQPSAAMNATMTFILMQYKEIETLEKGKKVVFISDDPASPIDFSHFSENEGYSISIKTSETGKHFFTLSKLEL